jgi:hypothetical protein
MISNPIVVRALELAAQHPQLPALQILDAALDGRHGTHPAFECQREAWADWIEPPSTFAALLRQALAPELADADFDAESEHWQQVVDRFARRYALWGNEGQEYARQ